MKCGVATLSILIAIVLPIVASAATPEQLEVLKQFKMLAQLLRT